MTENETPQLPCQSEAERSVANDPKLRKAIEIIIELCYRYGRDSYRRRQAGEVVNDER